MKKPLVFSRPIHKVKLHFQFEPKTITRKKNKDHSRYSIGDTIKVVVVSKSNKYYVWWLTSNDDLVYSHNKTYHNLKFAKRAASQDLDSIHFGD